MDNKKIHWESWGREKGFSLLLLCICLGFYGFFAFYDKAVICVDSPSYINMDISREPLYPLLLWLFRGIFSSFSRDFYLTAIAFFQSMLAAFASFSLVRFLWRVFRLSWAWALILLAMPLAVSLLCRFAAKRGSMYSNSILTEGITISCYLFFFRYLLEYFYHMTKKSLLLCCILTFCMISARKQMLLALFMLLVVILIKSISAGKIRKGIILAGVCAFVITAGSALLDLGYNYSVRGEAVRHSSDGRFLTTMAFYTAERGDADYIADKGIRELFLKIYDVCDEKGYLKNSAGEGWLNRVSHFGDSYDCIQIDTMWPAVNEYVRIHMGHDGVEMSEYADRIMKEINLSVLPHNIGSMIGSFLDNFLSGLVTTVAQRKVLLNWYSLSVYIFYILLAAENIWKCRKHKRGIDKTTQLALLTLLSVFMNVGLVSLVIFCQTRYTIYNMALFYISLLLLLHSRFASGRRIHKITEIEV